MNESTSTRFGGSPALLTDLYQLTMAYGYWKSGVADREAVFHLFFRKAPFGGAYAICAGIASVLAYLRDLRFSIDDLDYLATLRGADDRPLFERGFLDALGAMRWALTIDAVPEGAAVFAHEPILRVQGPMLQAQLVETALLTLINFETLIATKAARVCDAAGEQAVLEFGLRRAQGVDGGLAASRAAHLGGCAATSNVLAGKQFGIPVRGTHAHSWVMFHPDEKTAFETYAAAMPGNCTFLVDTYDTHGGVANAIEVGKQLRADGHTLNGVRLDSGDLARLSIDARQQLDDAGFPDAHIVASNDLDEHVITNLKSQGARIDTWGVGTKLVTAYDQPALGGVYKLGAVRDEAGAWRDVIKLSEQPIKISNPGRLQIRRLWRGDALVGDIVYDVDAGLSSPLRLHALESFDRAIAAPQHDRAEDVMTRILDGGAPTVAPTLAEGRARAQATRRALSPYVRRFVNPEPFPVGLDGHVSRRKRELIEQAHATTAAQAAGTVVLGGVA